MECEYSNYCPICKDIHDLSNIHQLKCGHELCHDCYSSIMNVSPSKNCPYCRNPMNIKYLLHNIKTVRLHVDSVDPTRISIQKSEDSLKYAILYEGKKLQIQIDNCCYLKEFVVLEDITSIHRLRCIQNHLSCISPKDLNYNFKLQGTIDKLSLIGENDENAVGCVSYMSDNNVSYHPDNQSILIDLTTIPIDRYGISHVSLCIVNC